MNARQGLFGGLGFGAAAVLLVALLPPAGGPPAPSRPADSPTTARVNEPEVAGGSERGGQLLRAYCGDLVSADSERYGCPEGVNVEILVATLPDPYDSNLDWGRDAYVESVRRALGTTGYVTDRFSFLGRTDSVDVMHGAQRVRLARREVEPDVMLFRRTSQGDRLRLVYIVSELPTSGIHKEALRLALTERRTILEALGQEVPDTALIVAPVFSGSMASLSHALSDWSRDSAHPRDAFLVLSGSATAPGNESTLKLHRPPARYEPVLRNDSVMLAAVLHALTDSTEGLAIRRARIAILHENTSEYGENVSVAQGGIRTIPFPLSIASLRSEYQRLPDQEPAGAVRRSSRVPLALDDQLRPRLAPPVVSRLTPASLDVMMEEIVHTLRREEITTIIIVATDVRDKLFLGELLRKRIRDVQLVTLESNRLYVNSARGRYLQGMIVASTYPLVAQNQAWTDTAKGGPAGTGGRQELLVFVSDGAQGIYNATLRALGAESLQLEQRGPLQMGDTTLRRTPVWLTVVGAHGMLPLRPYDDGKLMVSSQSAPCRSPVGQMLRPRDCSQVDPASAEVQHAHYGLSLLALLSTLGVAGTLIGMSVLYLVNAWSRLPAPVPSGGTARAPTRIAELSIVKARAKIVLDAADSGKIGALQRAALELHAELYRGTRILGILTVLLPVVVVSLIGSYPGPFLGVGLTVGAAIAILALLSTALFALYWIWSTGAKWLGSALGGGTQAERLGVRLWRAAVRTWLILRTGTHWLSETLARTLVTVALLYFAATLYVQLRQVLELGGYQKGFFQIFYVRAVEFTSGVSPITPLILIGAGITLWSTWHVHRVDALREGNAFSGALLGPQLRREADSRTAPSGTLAGLRASVRTFDQRLFYLIPLQGSSVVVLLLMVCLTLWLWVQFGVSNEALIFPRVELFSVDATLTPFDRLLRLGIIGGFWASTWALVRMYLLWDALSATLRGIAATPLLRVMKMLPESLHSLARPTLFGRTSHTPIRVVAERQWSRLAGMLRQSPEITTDIGAALLADQSGGTADRRNGVASLHAVVAALQRPMPGSESDPRMEDWHAFDRSLTGSTRSTAERRHDLLASDLVHMHRLLDACWQMQPDAGTLVQAVTSQKASATGYVRALDGDVPAPFTHSISAVWLQGIEEFVAVQSVDYIDWAQQSLRRLAPFLLASLLLMTMLLSSYHMAPQQLLKVLLVWLMAAVIGVSMVIMMGMSRDETLSALTRTTAGAVEWNSTFVLNVMLYGLIPILALVSSEVPFVRDVLFSWLEPMLRSIAKL